MNRVRVVLDTSVVVSAALFSNSLPRKVLELCVARCEVLISQSTLAELFLVLVREKFNKYLSRKARIEFLVSYAKKCRIVEVTSTFSDCRDPKDNMVLDLAHDGMASYLITGDQDLLVLHPFQGIKILSPAEFLASPQCRHCQAIWDTEWEYCPECQLNYAGAKYPAVVTDKELAEAEALVAEIRQAFDGVRLDGGTTLHEGDLEGAYTDPSVRLKAREKDPEQCWWEIPARKLEELSTAVHFLDNKGYRFHLPAWMIWCLRHGKKTQSLALDAYVNSLVPEDLVPRAPVFATLSQEQSRAVCRFLRHVANYFPHTQAEKALREYWHRFRD